MLRIDGAFAPARDATPGSTLTLAGGKVATVQYVTTAHGAIINAVTTSGSILAAVTGEPVIAATHPEWSAGFMLEKSVRPLELEPMRVSRRILSCAQPVPAWVISLWC